MSNLAHAGQLNGLIIDRIENTDLSDFSGFDGVFHLAAQASVPISISKFTESSSTNLLSAINVIEYCAKTRTPLVYASSSAVYGNMPLGDERSGVDLLSPYAVDKVMLEMYCDVASKLHGLRSYGLRFFNVYGPRQDPSNPYSGVISIFANQILKGEPIKINGGYQTRDFIYVGDVVRGLWASYLHIKDNPVATVSNLLTGNSISIDELADKICLLVGVDVKRSYQVLSACDPEKSLGSVELMNKTLELGEFINLDSGLNEVLKWIKMSNG
jgi:UDP-glucose 4-epimerase